VPELNKGLAERVELFTRATSDALQKAVGDVHDARPVAHRAARPGALHRLAVDHPAAGDLAKRLSTTPPQTLQEQVAANQSRVQALLRTAIETSGDDLHTLALLQWDGDSSASVLAAAGRLIQQGLSADQELLLIARRLGELLADDGLGAGHGKSQ
jgi:hypothetical protein